MLENGKMGLLRRVFEAIFGHNVINRHFFRGIRGHRPANLDPRVRLCVTPVDDNRLGRWLRAVCNLINTPHSALSCHSLPLGARDYGRSMIEMLGVLAIIGVLSVGGIAGYSKAMEKFKVNKLVEEYTNLMFGLMQHIDYFTPLRAEGEYQGRYYLADTIQSLDLVPAGWQKHASGKGFMDSSGNMIYTYTRNKHITFDLQLGETKIDDSGSYNIIQSFSNKLCFELFNNMLQPLHSSLFFAGIWKNKSAGVIYYGDKYCGADDRCLRDMTLSDIQSLCNSCRVNVENCIVVWELDNI